MLQSDQRSAFLRRARSHLILRIKRWNECQIHDVISDGQSLVVLVGSKLQFYTLSASRWQFTKEMPRREIGIKDMASGRILYADGLVVNLLDDCELQLPGVDFHISERGWLAQDDAGVWTACDWNGNLLWKGAGQRVSDYLLNDLDVDPDFIPVYLACFDEELFTVGFQDSWLQLRNGQLVLKQLDIGYPNSWYLSADHLILVHDDMCRIVQLQSFAECQLESTRDLRIIPNDYAFDQRARQFIKLHFD